MFWFQAAKKRQIHRTRAEADMKDSRSSKRLILKQMIQVTGEQDQSNHMGSEFDGCTHLSEEELRTVPESVEDGLPRPYKPVVRHDSKTDTQAYKPYREAN